MRFFAVLYGFYLLTSSICLQNDEGKVAFELCLHVGGRHKYEWKRHTVNARTTNRDQPINRRY